MTGQEKEEYSGLGDEAFVVSLQLDGVPPPNLRPVLLAVMKDVKETADRNWPDEENVYVSATITPISGDGIEVSGQRCFGFLVEVDLRLDDSENPTCSERHTYLLETDRDNFIVRTNELLPDPKHTH